MLWKVLIPKHKYLTVSSPVWRDLGNSTNLIEILSDENKRRCQAQLAALEKSVKYRKNDTKKQAAKKQAAVLIPLCFVDCQPSIIFTLRSSRLRRNAGQVSFPGGIMSEEDNDSVETALRESEEELGLLKKEVDVWGTMLPLPDNRGELQITPIIANLGTINVNDFKPNYDEVECVFTRDISSLCSVKNYTQTTFTTPQGGYTLPVFLGGEHRIWGLTAIILHQTLSLIAPGMYKNKIKHPKSLRNPRFN